MSEVMLHGVLRMPYELAMSDELSRRQFHDRAQEAAAELDRLQARVAELEVALSNMLEDGDKTDREQALAVLTKEWAIDTARKAKP